MVLSVALSIFAKALCCAVLPLTRSEMKSDKNIPVLHLLFHYSNLKMGFFENSAHPWTQHPIAVLCNHLFCLCCAIHQQLLVQLAKQWLKLSYKVYLMQLYQEQGNRTYSSSAEAI